MQRLVMQVERSDFHGHVGRKSLPDLAAHDHEVVEITATLRRITPQATDLVRDPHVFLRELHRLGIDVPTIVVSAVRVTQSRLDEFHPMAYLPKPFPLEALLRLVFGATSADPRGLSEADSA